MDLPGVHSILFKPASEVWPGEQRPSLELTRLIDGLPGYFQLGKLTEARESLDQIARFELQPSQTMRLHFWQGELFVEKKDLSQAFAFYDMALGIATDSSDFDSIIELTLAAAGAVYGLLRYRDALMYYEIALDTWRNKAPDVSTRRLDTETMLQNFIGRQKWEIGEFEGAQQILARVLPKALRAPQAARTPRLKIETANALWMLGLTLRAQSDMRDGDEGYLRIALRRMRKAVGLYEQIGIDANILGRFDIQIAEVYLDLAELHLQRGAEEAARAMRNQGLAHVNQAKEYLTLAGDSAADALARITDLRARVMRPSATESVQSIDEIEATLTEIEHVAAALNDRILIAKAATLRAEWLMALGENEKARDALLWALKGFNPDGMGMATRAQRLLRRLNASINPGGLSNPVKNIRN